jgi:hypothetical protein
MSFQPDILSPNIREWYDNARPEEIKKVLECGFMYMYPEITKRGAKGENYVYEILKKKYNCFPINSSKATDLCVELDNNRYLIEVKTYKNAVPKAELDKFYRDIDICGYSGGIFISLLSDAKPEIKYKTYPSISGLVSLIFLNTMEEDLIYFAIEVIHRQKINGLCDDVVLTMIESISKLRNDLRENIDLLSKKFNSNYQTILVLENQLLNCIGSKAESDKRGFDANIEALYLLMNEKFKLSHSDRKKIKSTYTYENGMILTRYAKTLSLFVPHQYKDFAKNFECSPEPDGYEFNITEKNYSVVLNSI